MFGFQVHHQVEGLADAAVGFGYLAAAIDSHQQPRDSVVVEDGGGLLVVELDTVTDDLLGIVGTAADGGTLVDALHQLVTRHIDGYHTVDLALQLPEEELQRLRLRDGARESIDDAALRTVRLCGCIAVRTRVPG